MNAICNELLLPSHKPLWFVGFQEVVDKLYTTLEVSLQSANYTMFRQPTDGYGCAMAVYKNSELSILDHGWQPYSATRQNRGLLWVHVRAHALKRTILFATTHLESFSGPSDTGAEQRAQQIQQIDEFCETKSCNVAIINGDMNWDDELGPRSRRQLVDVPLLSLLPADTGSSWTDTWLVANANSKTTDPGYTYDPRKNPMFNGSYLRRRFDRCLIRGTEATVLGRPQIVGQAALPKLTFEKVNPYTALAKTMPVAPSDHFGYVCNLQILPK
jgi:endonuclease/exonuclease/phosphatase family metal-dependent hydrolase